MRGCSARRLAASAAGSARVGLRGSASASALGAGSASGAGSGSAASGLGRRLGSAAGSGLGAAPRARRALARARPPARAPRLPPLGSARPLRLLGLGLRLLHLVRLFAFDHTFSISTGGGFWASCGCSGPAYTFSLRSCWRASRLRGSMPFTASRMTSSGRRCEHLLERPRAQAPGIAGVVVVELGRALVAGHVDLLGVHDHDEVAGVDVGRVLGLALAAQHVRDLGREPAERLAVGVDEHPVALAGRKVSRRRSSQSTKQEIAARAARPANDSRSEGGDSASGGRRSRAHGIEARRVWPPKRPSA